METIPLNLRKSYFYSLKNYFIIDIVQCEGIQTFHNKFFVFIISQK